MYKADMGAIRFKVRYPTGMGLATFTLTAKKHPYRQLYQVLFEPTCRFLDFTHSEQPATRNFHLAEPIMFEFKEFWLTWHSGVICLGVDSQSEPVLTYTNNYINTSNIGFVLFIMNSVQGPVEWVFESSPVILTPPKEKSFEGGHLHWSTLTNDNYILPAGALIAGFENEPIYVTRAAHNGSLCPGKYVPSKHCGYIAWRGRAYAKHNNQILCGFNVKWVKTKDNRIPENAFVAGYAGIRHEPLYVGRAMYDNQLLVGRVHTVYGTCYLPYKGEEVEMYEYEILVTTKIIPRSVVGKLQYFGLDFTEDEIHAVRNPRT